MRCESDQTVARLAGANFDPVERLEDMGTRPSQTHPIGRRGIIVVAVRAARGPFAQRRAQPLGERIKMGKIVDPGRFGAVRRALIE